MANFKVADLKLADKGKLRIEWAESRMPVLMALREKYKDSKPLKGHRIAGCLHVTKETAVLIRTLRAAGAEISWSGCNPLSTQDDVAAALAAEGTSIYAWHGLNKDEFYWCIDQTIQFKPTLTLDDGADLIFTVHAKHPELARDDRRRHRRDHHGRPSPARHGRATASCSTRSSPSTTPRPSGTSTTSTAPGSRRSTASCAPRRCCWPARPSSSPATATAARGVAHARQGHGRQRRRHRDQADRGAQGDARGLPRHDDGRGRQDRRHLHHRDGHEGHHRRPPLRLDEGRRARLQHRPLRLRDQPRRPRGARQGQARDPREQRGVRDSRTGAASTCSARDASSTSPPPRVTRRRSWTCRSPTSSWACSSWRSEGKTLEKKVYELPPELDQEIAATKLSTMGLIDRQAHRRAGVVRRRLLRRHVESSARHSSRALRD